MSRRKHKKEAEITLEPWSQEDEPNTPTSLLCAEVPIFYNVFPPKNIASPTL